MTPASSVVQHPLLSNSYRDVLTPGVQVELDAGEAEALGLIDETALSEADAWDSNADLVADAEPASIDFQIAANDDEGGDHG